MANNLDITEVTLAQLSTATHAVNVVGDSDGNVRLSVYQPAVVRVTDHEDDAGGDEKDIAENMALFHSKAHGQPWKKDDCQVQHKIWKGDDPIDGDDDDDYTVIYPNFTYTTFE